MWWFMYDIWAFIYLHMHNGVADMCILLPSLTVILAIVHRIKTVQELKVL